MSATIDAGKGGCGVPGFDDAELEHLRRVATAIAGGVLRSRAAAAECAAISMEQFIETHRSGEIRNNEAWIATTAKRRAIDQIRREVSERAALAEVAASSAVVGYGSDDPADVVISNDRVERLLGLIEDFEEPRRSVMKLRAQGFSADEIAELLGLTNRSVRTHFYRARAILRERWSVGVAALFGWRASTRGASHRRIVIAASLTTVSALALTPWLGTLDTPGTAIAQPCTNCLTGVAETQVERKPKTHPTGVEPSLASRPTASPASSRVVHTVRVGRTGHSAAVITVLDDDEPPEEPVALLKWCVAHFSLNLQHLICDPRAD